MIGAIVQARLNSKRLGQKVLLEMPKESGVTVLDRIVNRLLRCETLCRVIVTTPDAALVRYVKRVPVHLATHKERDVLKEFYQAARRFGLKTIVRITADCPCIDPDLVDKVVREHLKARPDYSYLRNDNLTTTKEIDGLDVEVFGLDVLTIANEKATKPYDREHVTPYIYEHFKNLYIESGWDLPRNLKLSLDTPKDYEFLCELYKKLPKDFGMKDIQDYFKEKDSDVSHHGRDGRSRTTTGGQTLKGKGEKGNSIQQGRVQTVPDAAANN